MSEKKFCPKRPTRRSELDAWFARHRVTKREASQAVGVSPARLNQLLQGIYLTPEWRGRLIEVLGIPSNLLPHAREYQ